MNRIKFSYSVYFRENCVAAIFGVFLCSFLFVENVITIVSSFPNLNVEAFFVKNMPYLLLAIVILYNLIGGIVRLARGGIFLLQEREKDAVVIKGMLEGTFSLSFFGYYMYPVQQNKGKGEGIIINGKKYYLMTYGDFKKGDVVTIKVLPKSKLILEISSQHDRD